jgi:orotidine-5'-phosphate decarboxylase
MRGLPDAIFQFNRQIIDATAPWACCYKPQFAHYAALGAEDQLLATIRHIHEQHPGLQVILDSKRGDIGSTAAKYAQESFVRYGADAVTVNPYLGLDSVQPYLQWRDRGVIVLCRTSNPGARDFQDLESGGKRLYRHVAERVARDWNGAGNCMLVIGATYPQELAEIRGAVGDLPFLVPGVGAQGGDVAGGARRAQRRRNGLVLNSSRHPLRQQRGRFRCGGGRRRARAARRDQPLADRALARYFQPTLASGSFSPAARRAPAPCKFRHRPIPGGHTAISVYSASRSRLSSATSGRAAAIRQQTDGVAHSIGRSASRPALRSRRTSAAAGTAPASTRIARISGEEMSRLASCLRGRDQRAEALPTAATRMGCAMCCWGAVGGAAARGWRGSARTCYRVDIWSAAFSAAAAENTR